MLVYAFYFTLFAFQALSKSVKFVSPSQSKTSFLISRISFDEKITEELDKIDDRVVHHVSVNSNNMFVPK
jgi:hypothetical protein